MRGALLMVLLLLPVLSTAGEGGSLFTRPGEGWFWYEAPDPEPEPETKREAPEAELPAPAATAPATPDPVAALQALQQALEAARAAAIMTDDPSEREAAVRSYMRLNQEVMARSGAFAESWQRVLWSTPALDTRLEHPVNDQAVHVRNDTRLAAMDAALRELAATRGLLFFFKSDCPYCHRFAPVLRAFAGAYGFHVIPVSLDGGGLPEYPHPRLNAGAGVALQVDTVPAVYLVEPRSRAIHPVSFGYVSHSELRDRIYTLMAPGAPDPFVTRILAGD